MTVIDAEGAPARIPTPNPPIGNWQVNPNFLFPKIHLYLIGFLNLFTHSRKVTHFIPNPMGVGIAGDLAFGN